MEPNERLQLIRRQRGFAEATDAARRHSWNENTYRSHENGTRPLSKKAAGEYARAFKVPAGWLLYGEGDPGVPTSAPLVGYVSAGSAARFYDADQDELDRVELPPGGGPQTVAVKVQGASMAGIADDGWVIYYEDIHTPPTEECLNKLCVVRLLTGQTLIKRLVRGKSDGLFDLWSTNEPPMLDQKVEWAARVTWIRPA